MDIVFNAIKDFIHKMVNANKLIKVVRIIVWLMVLVLHVIQAMLFLKVDVFKEMIEIQIVKTFLHQIITIVLIAIKDF